MSNNSSFNTEAFDCNVVSSAFTLTKMTLLVPLYTFILYLGVQKWKQQRSFSTATHSEIFTYHLAAFVVFLVVAEGLYFCVGVPSFGMLQAMYFLFNMNWYGESYIHVLTCVEQYLAVVHPIVYMRLRNSRGVRIRNIGVGCVWLLTLMSSVFISLYTDPNFPILFVIPFAVCLVAVSFCCFSVLCVLIRPGPGEGGRVDQSKQRAFHTITAILVVLWLWLGGVLFSYALYITLPGSPEGKCLMVNMAYWFNLPSGLVLPLLYLHRAGKLSFCCCKNG